jgi:hypothetical protein
LKETSESYEIKRYAISPGKSARLPSIDIEAGAGTSEVNFLRKESVKAGQ